MNAPGGELVKGAPFSCCNVSVVATRHTLILHPLFDGRIVRTTRSQTQVDLRGLPTGRRDSGQAVTQSDGDGGGAGVNPQFAE
jgi:hypothetical protein